MDTWILADGEAELSLIAKAFTPVWNVSSVCPSASPM